MSSGEGQHKVRNKDSKAGKEEKEKSWDREGKKERKATSKSKKVVPDMKSFFQFTMAGSLKPHGCSVPWCTPRIHATSRPTSAPSLLPEDTHLCQFPFIVVTLFITAEQQRSPLGYSWIRNTASVLESPYQRLEGSTTPPGSMSIPLISGSAWCWTLFSLLSAWEGTAEQANAPPQKELQKGRRRLEGTVRTVSWVSINSTNLI